MSGATPRSCWKCGGPIASEKPGRRETCPKCGADVHVCKNCRFWDPSLYNECREPRAERVSDRERGNFCDWFEWRGGPASVENKSCGIADLEKLFKK